MAVLTAKQRNALKDSDFAIPERRAYPIHDELHARNALQRVSQHGTPEEKRRVKAAVRRRYPDMEVSGAAQGAVVSPAKAKQILRDGTIRGRRLTPRQKRYFGLLGGTPGRAAEGVVIGDIEAGFYEEDAAA